MVDQFTVFVCEAQPIVIEGLERVLTGCDDLRFLGAVSKIPDAMEAVREHRPDLILVDQSPGLKAVFQFITDVKSTWARCQPVLWINDLAEIDCFRALQLGARGVIRKSLPVAALRECLRAVGRGSVWIENSLPEGDRGSDRRAAPRLTPREIEIVHHVCGGLKNREIAGALSITPGTVKVHLMHIFEKTGVRDRFELAVQGRRLLGVEHADEIVRAGNAGA